MRVLLTGASGRLGQAIAARLAGTHQVIGLDLRPAPTTQVLCDLGNLDDPGQHTRLARLFDQGIDAVIHAAALHAPHVGQVPEAAFMRVNVEATRHLHALATAAGVRRFVFTSTTALYGHAVDAALAESPPRAAWLTAASAPQPRTIYHRSKWQAEQALVAATQAQAAAPGLCILRVARCFPEPAPTMALYRLHRGVDARDVAEAHALALAAHPDRVLCGLVSGATPFEPGDAPALAIDAPAVVRHRAPRLAAVFDQRGWALPRCIDRVYDPQSTTAALGWRPRHGPEAVWQAPDAGKG